MLAVAAFFLDLLAAGRVSPRRATGFLARARKSAKKACCAASIPAVKLAARPAGAALKQLRRAWMGEGLLDQRLRFFLMPLKSGFFACCKASEEVIPQQLNRKGATVFNIASATRLTRRGCLSAAPKGREASFTAGIEAAQHAFFADFLARARKLVARRGESRPAPRFTPTTAGYTPPTPAAFSAPHRY